MKMKGVNNMDDLQIIELYFARDEHAIKETDIKYGKLCFRVAKNILLNNEDSEECVNDTYLTVWNKIPPPVQIILPHSSARSPEICP